MEFSVVLGGSISIFSLHRPGSLHTIPEKTQTFGWVFSEAQIIVLQFNEKFSIISIVKRSVCNCHVLVSVALPLGITRVSYFPSGQELREWQKTQQSGKNNNIRRLKINAKNLEQNLEILNKTGSNRARIWWVSHTNTESAPVFVGNLDFLGF